MITIDKLKSFGADTDMGRRRCGDNEALYLRLVATIPSQAYFEKMTEAVKSGDLKTGFESAHALKGVLGNLSLSPLYEKVCEITELLRSGTQMDYAPLLDEISSMKDQLEALCD